MALTRLPGFTLDSNSSFTFANASVTANVTAGNIKTDNLLYANGSPWALGGTYANSNVAAYLPTYTGQMANALVAGTVYINAQPNITSTGTLVSLTVSGLVTATSGGIKVGNLQDTSGTNTVQLTNSDILVTGNITAGSGGTGNVTATYFIGNGSQLTGLPATYSNTNVAAYLPTYTGNFTAGNANVSGTFAAANISTSGTSGNISGANVVSANSFTATSVVNFESTSNVALGSVSNVHILGGASGQYLKTDGSGTLSWADAGNATAIINGNSNVIVYANGNVATSASGTANVLVVTSNSATLTGTFSASNISTSGTSGNISGANNISANYFIGTLTTAAQPNITSIGTLSSLTVTNTITGGNLSTAGIFTAGDATITGNLTVNGTTVTANVSTLNVKDPIIEMGGNATGALTSNDGKDRGTLLHYYTTTPVDAFMGWDNSAGEFAFGSNVSVSSEVVTFNTLGNVRANVFIGALSGAATTAATVTTNSQPNITSVGTLASLVVTANVTAGNLIGPHANGNSNIDIPTANGNILVSVAGNSNIAAFTGVGLSVGVGILTRPGNVNPNAAFYAVSNIAPAPPIVMQNRFSNGYTTIDAVSSANIYMGAFGAANPTATAIPALANSTFVYSTADSYGLGLYAANGNVRISAANTANIAVVTGTGVNVAGTVNATGILSGSNGIFGGLITGQNFGLVARTTDGTTGPLGVQALNATNYSSVSFYNNANLLLGALGTAGTTATYYPNQAYFWSSNGIALSGNGFSATGGTKNMYINSSGIVTIPTGVAATNTTTGAFVVTGGVGVSGNLHAGGLLSVTGNITGNNAIFGTGAASGLYGQPLIVRSNTANNGSTLGLMNENTNAYAITVFYNNAAAETGAVGFGGKTAPYFANSVYLYSSATDSNGLILSGNIGAAPGNKNLWITNTGLVTIPGTTAAANTTSGAFQVTGGVGVGGNLYAGNLAATNVTGTLTTQVQPNITSVGTLASLSVTGNITSGNINGGNAVVANYFVGNGSLLTGLPASYANANVANYLPTYSGNFSPSNLVVSTSANLGAVGNVIITGGTADYVLKTDGAGNLSWTAQSGGSSTSTTISVDNFTGNGVADTYTLSVTPTSINSVFVNYNGAFVGRGSYSLSGANLTFGSIPANGASIEVTTIEGLTIGSGAFTTRTATGDGANVNHTVTSGATVSSVLVTLDGVLQTPTTDYTVSGSTLTFTTAPYNGAAIQIRELAVASSGGASNTSIRAQAMTMGIIFGG